MLHQLAVDDHSSLGEESLEVVGQHSGGAGITHTGLTIFGLNGPKRGIQLIEFGWYTFGVSTTGGDALSFSARIKDDNDIIENAVKGDLLFDFIDGTMATPGFFERKDVLRGVPVLTVPDATPPRWAVHRFPPEWIIRPRTGGTIGYRPAVVITFHSDATLGTTTFDFMAWVKFRHLRL